MAKKQTLFDKLRSERDIDLDYEEEGARYSIRIKVLIFIVTILLCSLFFTLHFDQKINESHNFRASEGSRWSGQTIVAEFTFPVYKPYDEYESEKQQAKENTPRVFKLNKDAGKTVKQKLETLVSRLSDLNEQNRDALAATFSDSTLSIISDKTEQERKNILNLIRREVEKMVNSAHKRGFISISKESINTGEISVRVLPEGKTIIKKEMLIDSSLFTDFAMEQLQGRYNAIYKPIGEDFASKVMIPNLIFSQELTNKAKELAAASVPRTVGIVRKGETIIEKGDEVTENHVLKLNSYESSRFMKSDKIYSIWMFLGSIAHVIIIYSILILYLFFIRKRIFYDNLQVGIISGMLVLIAIMSWMSLQVITKFPVEYIIFLPALSMLAAIVFDSRTAFYATVTMSLMLAGIRGNDYETSITMLFAGTLAAYSVRDIQSRTQVYSSIFFIFMGFLLAIVAFGLERSVEFLTSLYKAIIALINSAISPLITFGLLFLLERITNIATDLRIKEFDNLNHPLLVKLSEIAPGTYQHTLTLAVLCEKCANAIGANPLLAKVGSYYHDIGKITKPEYFAENQIDMESKHNLITPKKSAAAIREHVIKGVELAKQYKLPKRILNFIPMHHGTTLIKHFYAMAVEENEKGTVNEEDFRYPGPKPQTKETAILMICDSAEAMSRVKSDDKNAFANALESLVEDRILDGQFDECNITFKELEIIKETCIKNLTGVSHKRVAYKQLPNESNKKK